MIQVINERKAVYDRGMACGKDSGNTALEKPAICEK